MTNHWLSLIVLAPLIGAIINWLVGRRVKSEAFIGFVACASIGVSTVIAFIIAFTDNNGAGAALFSEPARPVMSHLWTWMEVGNFRADVGFAMDRLSGIYVCFVTFVGLLIHVFATGYMHGDKSFYRFFAYLNLFMFMMLTLVLGDNLLLMFVGWEGVGLCSYLLIGYYVDRKEAGNAAKKAFIANRVGDWGVILGIMFVFFITAAAGAPSISFFEKTNLTNLVGGQVPAMTNAFATIAKMAVDPFTMNALIAGGLTSAAILLFIGATGKSAQIPLFVWLPDAMAGPTPVSALIHAATMVTAGVYMIVRCSELYVRAPTAMAIIAVIGAATALLAATIGLAQNDIKKVLAYSTVSQLGYMMLACGVGAFSAAIFHVMTHAFFKALLFLGSGSVIHGMHHEQDMRRMGGLRKYMPITWITSLIGTLALVGTPLFSGFYSKDTIIEATHHAAAHGGSWVNQYAYWAVLLGVFVTSFYSFRLLYMTFHGKEKWGQSGVSHHKPHDAKAGEEKAHSDPLSHHGPVEPHESPWVVTVPLILLAIPSIAIGYLTVGPMLFGEFFADSIFIDSARHGAMAALDEKFHGPMAFALHGLVTPAFWLALAGFASATFIYLLRPGLSTQFRRKLGPVVRVLENKYGFDDLYQALFARGGLSLGKGLWKAGDVAVIDNGLVNGPATFIDRSAGVLRYLQSGYLYHYAIAMILGLVGLLAFARWAG